VNAKHSILYFTNSTVWGGVEEHICGLLRHLSRGLFRPHLVCAPATFERFRSASPGDVEITPLPLLSPTHFGAAEQLIGLIRRGRFHIVHSHMFWSSLCASPIAWACRVPVIVETLHGTEAWRSGWKASCRVDRLVTRFVSQYIAVCNSDAQFLVEKKRVPAEKIAVIRNGVENRRFAASPSTRKAMRETLGYAEDDLVLIMVARFHPGKGHRVLLEAMTYLLPSFPKLKLICLGEGEGEAEVRRSCEALGLSEHVRLPGHQKNVADWLRVVDINVLPSFYEGLPLTLLESMASGLPSVATRVGGVVDAIEDGISGLLVPSGDAMRLAEALRILLHDAEARKRMGNAAFVRASRYFGIEQQICNTEKTYLDLCGAPEHELDEAHAQVLLPREEHASVFLPVQCGK
jgi:glycosyltransferase involved in cell wall biosynthesis